MPFDQLIIFSTNLEPRQLVDEAFLAGSRTRSRRLTHRRRFSQDDRGTGRQAGLQGRRSRRLIDYLIAQHYRQPGRPFRCCHPRDLLLQVRSFCVYNDVPLELKPEYFDFAVMNYFTTM